MTRPLRLLAMALALLSASASAQRGRNYLEQSEYGRTEKPPVRHQGNDKIGRPFPYRRGETPIFHFDQGDEQFLETITPLIKGLHSMAAHVSTQNQEMTSAFAEVFKNCRDCKVSKWENFYNI